MDIVNQLEAFKKELEEMTIGARGSEPELIEKINELIEAIVKYNN
jgi:hypothetical protein